MVSRNVVSEISDNNKATYIGPVNYITHHEVYKPGSLSTPICLVQGAAMRPFLDQINTRRSVMTP